VRRVGTAGPVVEYVLEAQARQRSRAIEPVGPIRLHVLASPDESLEGPVLKAVRLEIPLATRDRFPATGVQATDTRASGNVRFHSENTLQDLIIPEGTPLRTPPGVRFVTRAPAALPRASFQNGPTEVDVSVEAVDGGDGGNVPAGTISEVPEDLAAILVSVTNPEPTTAGSRTESPMVSERDYEEAVRQLSRQLDEKLAARLGPPADASSELVIHPGTAQRGEVLVDPLAETTVGRPIDSFRLSARATATATAVDETVLAEIGLARLRESMLPGNELIEDSEQCRVVARDVHGEAVTYTIEARGRQHIGPVIAAGPVRLVVVADPDLDVGPPVGSEPTSEPGWESQASPEAPPSDQPGQVAQVASDR